MKIGILYCAYNCKKYLTDSLASFIEGRKQNTIFKIEYTGKDPLPTFTQAFPVSVFGHVHNGEPPYVHASQIIGH